jgi:hypothetical protein
LARVWAIAKGLALVVAILAGLVGVGYWMIFATTSFLIALGLVALLATYRVGVNHGISREKERLAAEKEGRPAREWWQL